MLNTYSVRFSCHEFADEIPAFIFALIIDKNYFKVFVKLLFQPVDYWIEAGIVLFQHFLFVINRDYDRNHPGSSIADFSAHL